MKYYYFVSYNGKSGCIESTGCFEYTTKSKITTFDSVLKMHDFIKNKEILDSAVVNNFILLRKEK